MNPVQVDFCHGDLIESLIKCHKPKTVLELGFGSGFTTRKIQAALEYNEKEQTVPKYGSPAQYTLVDNWLDWSEKGQPPPDLSEFQNDRTKIVVSNEHDFVFNAKTKWDFIFSDADHFNTEKWFEYVYNNLLNDNGILIYHDICEKAPENGEFWFPNLKHILDRTRQLNLSHYLFNRDSLVSEKCWRGLLVIFKNRVSK
jgi:predicted O-methyltransferase YrrM